jgi:uncharacterized protein
MERMNYLSPWIQTTDKCNLKCPYCFVEQKDVDMPKEVYKSMTSQFLSLLDNEKVDFIKLRIAGGEPLIVFDTWKEPIGQFLDEAGEKGGAEILTNLVRIPKGFIDYALEHETLGVNVSLDSLTMSKPFGNGKSSSPYVLSNIDKLKDSKGIFIMTVLTENGRYLPDLAKYVTENRFRWEVQLNKFHETDIDRQEVVRNLEKVVDEFTKQKLSVRDYFLFNFCDFRTTRICEAGQKMFYINPVGDIYNCQMQEHGKPLTNIGNPNLLEKLQNNHVGRPYIALCGNCSIGDFCHGDCPVNNGPARREYFCDIMKGFFTYAAKNVLKFGKKDAKKPAGIGMH